MNQRAGEDAECDMIKIRSQGLEVTSCGSGFAEPDSSDILNLMEFIGRDGDRHFLGVEHNLQPLPSKQFYVVTTL